jgi:hypothetical protein
MTVRGRPLTLAFAAASFAVVGGAYALIGGTMVLAMAGLGIWSLLQQRPLSQVPSIWTVVLVPLVSVFAAVWLALCVYLPLKAARQLWRRIPGGLGLPRVLGWLALAANALGLLSMPGHHPGLGQYLLVAWTIVVVACLYAHTTTREFKATWVEQLGA